MKVRNGNNICVNGLPAEQVFKGAFVLGQKNIRQFVNFHRRTGFDGKFVFYLKIRKMALHPGEDKFHRQIAGLVVGRYEETSQRERFAAAYLNFEMKGKELRFGVDGGSEFFGRPSREKMIAVADYLADLLARAGFRSVIVKYLRENEYAITCFSD